MKNTNIILQREDSSKIFISSKNSVREWVKHFLTLIYSLMVFISFLSITDLDNQNRLPWIFSLIWILIIISIIKSLMTMNVKALYYSFQGIFVSLLMYALSISYGCFLTFYVAPIKIVNPEDFNNIFIYFTPAVMFIGLWKIIISFEERRTNPHFTKQLFFDGTNQILFGIPSLLTTIGMEKIVKDIQSHGIKGLTENFNNSLILYLIIIFSLIVVGLNLFKWSKWGKDSATPWVLGNTTFASAFITIIPLSIWLIFKYGVWINSFVSFIYVGLILILIIALIYFSFFTKDEARRSKLLMSYSAISLVLIWGMWFLYSYVSSDINGFMFSTTIATLSTGLVVAIIYLKSPELVKWIFWLYRGLINAIMYLVIILIIKYYISIELLKFLSSVVNIFNLALLAMPIIFLTGTLMS